MRALWRSVDRYRSRFVIPACLVLLGPAGCGDDSTGPSQKNHPPAAIFTVTPDSGSTAVEFHADASASTDAETAASDLTVKWDWEDDGAWDTSFDVEKSAGHQYSSAGTKTIRLEVRDLGGLSATTTRAVAVKANAPPEASFALDPDAGTTETLFRVDASGSTDDADSAGALHVRWDWEDDGVWDTEFTLAKTASHRFSTPGWRTIRLEVQDSDSASGSTPRQASVVPADADAMVLIPAGDFVMGSDLDEGYDDERPEHRPSVSSFFIDAFEVSNAKYASALGSALAAGGIEVVAGATYGSVRLAGGGSVLIEMDASNPPFGECRISYSGGAFGVDAGWENHPVVGLSWFGAAAYCNWRSRAEGLAACYDTTTWACDSMSKPPPLAA